MANKMFDEMIDVAKRLQEINNNNEKVNNSPAMIILERKETGENKHAMVGDLEDICHLFVWGIDVMASQTNCSFDDMITLIQLKKSQIKEHVYFDNIADKINKVNLKDYK